MIILATLNNGQVGRQVGVSNGLYELKATFKAPFVQIIEKQTSNTAGFITMLEIEIIVTPLFVAGINIIAKRLSGFFDSAMPMDNIIHVRVIRGQVVAAAKPPDRIICAFFSTGLAGYKETYIGVTGWNMGVVWMDDQ